LNAIKGPGAMNGAIQFPDSTNEACQRAKEFRRLSPDGRWKEITALMAWGLAMVRSSPRRAAIEQRWEAQEAEWQRIQRDLFARHAK